MKDYMHGLRRWSVYTTDGRKTTYAQTAEHAAKRARATKGGGA